MAHSTIKNYVAETAIPKRSQVKYGSTAGTVALATAATDSVIGTSSELDVVIGERVDVTHMGFEEVKFGGVVAVGAPFVANASGQAVAAAPAAGSNVRIGGFNGSTSSAAGDILPAHIQPGLMQG